MKMTPEQKAFYEYGELFQLWKYARRCVFWHEESHEDIRREIVQKVWRKRAVCRAWAHLERRECRTCRYHDEIRNFEICRDCTPGIHLENFCNWEPGTAADAAGENTDVNPHNSLMSDPAQVGETLADGKEGK